MKTLTCKDLGGACDTAFTADTFEDMAQLSQAHGREMMLQGDPDHIEAMKAMGEVMQSPEKMQDFMQAMRAKFDNAPNA